MREIRFRMGFILEIFYEFERMVMEGRGREELYVMESDKVIKNMKMYRVMELFGAYFEVGCILGSDSDRTDDVVNLLNRVRWRRDDFYLRRG